MLIIENFTSLTDPIYSKSLRHDAIKHACVKIFKVQNRPIDFENFIVWLQIWQCNESLNHCHLWSSDSELENNIKNYMKGLKK